MTNTNETDNYKPVKLEDLAKELLGLRADVVLTSDSMPEGFDEKGHAWRCILSAEETQSNNKTAPLTRTFQAPNRSPKTLTKRRAISMRYYTGSGIKKMPTALDLLNACLRDAQCVRYETFEGFCSSFGYDTDSRKAKKMYKACKRMETKMQRFLGERFEEFLDAEGL